jgi:hypothetical protein
VHTYNPSTGKAEAGGLKAQGQPGLHTKGNPVSKEKTISNKNQAILLEIQMKMTKVSNKNKKARKGCIFFLALLERKSHSPPWKKVLKSRNRRGFPKTIDKIISLSSPGTSQVNTEHSRLS